MIEKGSKREPKWIPRIIRNGHGAAQRTPRVAGKTEKVGKKGGRKNVRKKVAKLDFQRTARGGDGMARRYVRA